MSEPFYADPARRAALVAAMQRWHGTPFRDRSMVPGPGGGVSCVRLAYSIHLEAGAFEPFEIQDEVPLDWHLHHDSSGLLGFFRLEHVRARCRMIDHDDPPMTGDLVAIQTGRTPHHLGTAFDFESGRFVFHVPRDGRAGLVALDHPHLRVAGIFRILT